MRNLGHEGNTWKDEFASFSAGWKQLHSIVSAPSQSSNHNTTDQRSYLNIKVFKEPVYIGHGHRVH